MNRSIFLSGKAGIRNLLMIRLENSNILLLFELDKKIFGI